MIRPGGVVRVIAPNTQEAEVILTYLGESETSLPYLKSDFYASQGDTVSPDPKTKQYNTT